jgi:hypothetical protein
MQVLQNLRSSIKVWRQPLRLIRFRSGGADEQTDWSETLLKSIHAKFQFSSFGQPTMMASNPSVPTP